MRIRPRLVLAWMLGLSTLGLACSASDPPDQLSPAASPVSGRPGVSFCKASDACPKGDFCTTEEGECGSRPGCDGDCDGQCWGTCVKDTRQHCGTAICPREKVCCNESCGICAAPNEPCTRQWCGKLERWPYPKVPLVEVRPPEIR